MSDVKHTPGPWQSDELGITGSGATGPENVVLIWAGPNGVKKADADLVTAAPDLLAACKLFMKYDGGSCLIETKLYNAVKNAIVAAVAKAEGT